MPIKDEHGLGIGLPRAAPCFTWGAGDKRLSSPPDKQPDFKDCGVVFRPVSRFTSVSFMLQAAPLWLCSLANNIINPLTAKLFNLNFHPLEGVSR